MRYGAVSNFALDSPPGAAIASFVVVAWVSWVADSCACSQSVVVSKFLWAIRSDNAFDPFRAQTHSFDRDACESHAAPHPNELGRAVKPRIIQLQSDANHGSLSASRSANAATRTRSGTTSGSHTINPLQAAFLATATTKSLSDQLEISVDCAFAVVR